MLRLTTWKPLHKKAKIFSIYYGLPFLRMTVKKMYLPGQITSPYPVRSWHLSYQWKIAFLRSIVLDYDITINKLREADRIFVGGSLGNYSLAGFEMILRRHVSHYIINYYLPSGLFVVVSWISFLVPADIIPGTQNRPDASAQ